MSCNTSDFVITKGLDNEFIFTIKQTGSSLPMEIVTDVDPDTFTAKLVRLEDQVEVLEIELVVTSALSGRVKLLIPAASTVGLESKRGDEIDGYYLKPAYKLVIDCDTQNNGKFIAKICEVYVD